MYAGGGKNWLYETRPVDRADFVEFGGQISCSTPDPDARLFVARVS